jgi:hypothetical protein
MAPIVASTPIIMTSLTKITSLSTSIYESSLVTFINDTLAYTTVDIYLSKLTKVTCCTYDCRNRFPYFGET